MTISSLKVIFNKKESSFYEVYKNTKKIFFSASVKAFNLSQLSQPKSEKNQPYSVCAILFGRSIQLI